MYYAIQHTTTFQYSEPISESMMEVRMQPRTEGLQQLINFQLAVMPRTHSNSYRDYLGNTIHHFDVPGKHQKLVIRSEATVELRPGAPMPETLSDDTWAELDQQTARSEFFDFLMPSTIAHPTPLLRELMRELDVERRLDPLTVVRQINEQIYYAFEYVPEATRFDSPIDDVLNQRQGVCQDYSHVMIAFERALGIPCRYVSGYLFHRTNSDRSAQDATHAWVEVWLPSLGWIGFDPTNNLICNDRHIRVAVGRDYSDVPSNRGVFKGSADTKLEVAVGVRELDTLPVVENLRQQTLEIPGYSEGNLMTKRQQEQQQQ